MADRHVGGGTTGGGGGGGGGSYSGVAGSTTMSRTGGEQQSMSGTGVTSSGAAHSLTEYAGGIYSGAGSISAAGYHHHHSCLLPPIHYITDQLLVTALPERKMKTTKTKNTNPKKSAANNDTDIGMDLSVQEEEEYGEEQVEDDENDDNDDDDDENDESRRYQAESLAALATFLKERHSFLIFSLADALPDEMFVTAVNRQVVHLPWQAAGSPVSEIPTVGTLLHICYALSAWLGGGGNESDDDDEDDDKNDDENDNNNSTAVADDHSGREQDLDAKRQRQRDQRRRRVAVVTCANGRTRTALACACFLHFAGQVENGVRDGFCHFCVRTFSHHIYAGGICAGGSASGGGAHGAGGGADDHNNIAAGVACLETPLDVWKELPPTLLTLLRNFEQALSLGRYLQRKPLCLRAIALQGVPVEEKPWLDVWDGRGRHLYSSHDASIVNINNKNNHNDSIAAPQSSSLLPSSHWADEEGFFKVNVLVEGDFCLLCRFGGTKPTTMQFTKINSDDEVDDDNETDATRILFRYANTTGFLSATPAALELPLSRVDVMRRYAPFFDPHDFLLSILWETDWTSAPTAATNYEENNNTNSQLLSQESSPEVLTPIYKADEARQEGWYLIWKHHVVATSTAGWDDLVQDFISCDAKLSGQQQQQQQQNQEQHDHASPPTPPLHLVSLALCLANLDPVEARFLLLRGRVHSWRKSARIKPAPTNVIASDTTKTTMQHEEKPSNDSFATTTPIESNARPRWRRSFEKDKETQTVLNVLDSVDVSAFIQDTDLAMAQIKTTSASRRHQQQQGEMNLTQYHLDADDHDHEDDTNTTTTDLPFESAAMNPNRGDVRNALLALPQRQAESAGSFHHIQHTSAAGGSRIAGSLSAARCPQVPVLRRLKNVTGDTAAAEQLQLLLLASSSSPLDDPENKDAVELLLQGLNHTGVALHNLVELVEESHEWNQLDGEECLTQQLASAAPSAPNDGEKDNVDVDPSADSLSTQSNPNEARHGNDTENPAQHMENEPSRTPAAIEAETAMNNNKGVHMKQDSRFEKYWKMKGVGLPEGAIRNAITRDGKDASIWDLDWDRNYEEQTVLSPTITDLPMKQDSRFEKYWKMKSVGLPEGAIRNAITRDGKDASIWDLDWDRNYEEQTAPSPTIINLPMKQDFRFEKYWKMKCVGLPEGAIRNAITRDGKDGAIWDLDWDKNYDEQTQPKKSAAPAMKEDSRFEKYWKMKSVGLPDGAIRNAMLRDGLDGSILDLNWEKNYETQTQKGMDDSTSIKDDPRFEKYWKMKLLGLPDGAIRNAMIRDGADASVLDLDWEKSLASQTTKTKDDGVPLKDDPEYSKFFKMLDMGLTKDAVKNALAREGKDPGIMELDPNKSFSTQKQLNGGSRLRTSIIPQKRVRRKKIFWKPIDPGQIKEDSLWSLVRGGSMSLLKFDAEEFEELFTESAEPNESNSKKKATSAGKVKAKKAVQVIDGKRSMNGGIILLRLRMEYKKIASIVRNMEHGALDATQLKALKDCLPSNEERQALQRYMEMAKDDEAKIVAFSDLSECEKYMYTMIDVPNADKKFDCMLFREQFHSRFNELVTSIRTLELACDEVKGSRSLREILGIILIVVNRINTGGMGNEAAGFSLEALLKLNEAKAFDKKTSVLHYLVTLVKRNDESLLEFQKDLTHVRQAQNIMLDNLLKEIIDLRQELELVHKTAQEDADQLPPGEKRPISLKELKEQITLVRCIADVKHYNQTDHVTGRTPMERFAMNAATSTETAMTMTEDVKHKYDKVLEYFGEAKDMTSNDFFGTMNRFLLEFSKAVEQVQREENAQLRRLKNAASSAKKFGSPKGQPKDAVEKPLVGSARLTSGAASVLVSKRQADETTLPIAGFGPHLESARSDIAETTSTQLRVSKPVGMSINGTRTDVGKKASTSPMVVVDATAKKSRNLASKAAETTVVVKKWARSKSPTTQDRLGLAAAAAAVAMSKRRPGESDVVVSHSSVGLATSNSPPKDTNLNGSNTFPRMNNAVDKVSSDGGGRHPSFQGVGIATAAALAAKKKQLSKSIGQFQTNGAASVHKTNSSAGGEDSATPVSLAKSCTSSDATRLGPASEKQLHSSGDDKAILVVSQGTGGNKGPAAFEASLKNAALTGGFGTSPAKRLERSVSSDHGISALAKNQQVLESPEIRLKKLASQTSDHAPASDELPTKHTW